MVDRWSLNYNLTKAKLVQVTERKEWISLIDYQPSLGLISDQIHFLQNFLACFRPLFIKLIRKLKNNLRIYATRIQSASKAEPEIA